jgi:organic hydroperoxide reductase OsmC/OhrA
MQKEAIVHNGFTNSAWRMACDEGPWLNGTDLSSFPLGFFSAGMAASLASEIVALAKQRGIAIMSLQLVQDARYTLEGSALKRTMTGSALPLETEVNITSDASKADTQKLVFHALAASPADAIMRTALDNSFKTTLGGRDIGVKKVKLSTTPATNDPAGLFEHVTPAEVASYAGNIIEKQEGADTSSNKKGGSAIGHAVEQKRVVQVRAALTLREDGLKTIQTQCIQPSGGSVFNFLSDDPEAFGGQGRAPTGLDYISAGVSFCFMTQLGRFAILAKQDLQSYGIVQDTRFSLPGASAKLDREATAEAADTHVFLTSDAGDEANRILVDMGEQTCYLHACYSGVAKTRLLIRDS